MAALDVSSCERVSVEFKGEIEMKVEVEVCTVRLTLLPKFKLKLIEDSVTSIAGAHDTAAAYSADRVVVSMRMSIGGGCSTAASVDRLLLLLLLLPMH